MKFSKVVVVHCKTHGTEWVVGSNNPNSTFSYLECY